MGKLFHIDLNGQRIGRYDQDFRFGQEDLKGAFFLVKLLEDNRYAGSRHFDAHPLRTEGMQGVWDFAAGCMRTYLILKEKVQRFNADAEIQGLLRDKVADTDGLAGVLAGGYSASSADRVSGLSVDRESFGKKDLFCEKIDQLTTEILLGVR